MNTVSHTRSHSIHSLFLKRAVQFDVYAQQYAASTREKAVDGGHDLLLFNDGQDLIKMNFDHLLSPIAGDAEPHQHQPDSPDGKQPHTLDHVPQKKSAHRPATRPLVVVGIYAGADRKQEYGVSGHPDYMGRGARAAAYSHFVLEELLPYLKNGFNGQEPVKKYLAGFSLGGLMAFDLLMDHPDAFSAVGVFSGAFWWRSKALGPGYNDTIHRIMHAKIRHKKNVPGLRFFLQTGQLDETEDRNKNGVIDSIDDTLAIIAELERLGYKREQDIAYLEMPDGRHNTETWARAMPMFLNWLG